MSSIRSNLLGLKIKGLGSPANVMARILEEEMSVVMILMGS